MKHFTIEELCESSTATLNGIDNTPDPDQRQKLKDLVLNVLDPAREILGEPINVSSGFRSRTLNAKVGGKPTSQHTKGEAADLQCNRLYRLHSILKELPHDQLILETKNILRNGRVIGKTEWIHVSYREGNNRMQSFALHNGKLV